jgi:hypothetical protein
MFHATDLPAGALHFAAAPLTVESQSRDDPKEVD